MRGKLVQLAILAGVVVAGCALTGRSVSYIRPGVPAPPTEGVDSDGQFFRLADFPGRVVMVSFWGNFCGPCRALFPHERALVEKYRGKPFVLLGVNGDADVRELKSAQIEKQLTWRSWWDGPAGPIARLWCVDCFPTVLLIDQTGVIRYRSDGSPNPRELDAKIEQLVKEVAAGADAR
jgi:thiol-disulfide isomerase/thioredoxin